MGDSVDIFRRGSDVRPTEEAKMKDEYRACLQSESCTTSSTRYAKLLVQLLRCQSVQILSECDKTCTEIGSYGHSRVLDVGLVSSFVTNFAGTKTLAINDLMGASETSIRTLRESGVAKSLIAAPITADHLRIGVLIVCDTTARSWTDVDVEAVTNVATALSTNALVEKERHMLSIQKRMQKSLVQFVRGNLASSQKRDGSAPMASLISDLDEDLDAEDVDDETVQIETSRMNVMFDLSARLIRRTLNASGCVLVNIEGLSEYENINAEMSARSTIMGACFIKTLRSHEWHEELEYDLEKAKSEGSSSRSAECEMQNKNVRRTEVFNALGLSGEWLKETLADHPRALAYEREDIPKELARMLPSGVSSCMLAPIYDTNNQAFALIVVFNKARRPFLKHEGHYLEAFSSSIYAEVLNQNLQAANDAKALFISKISHEFRTPLHGILASAEFLNDMPVTTQAQLGFVQTIDTCGRTLLDIINHVLEYSKLKFTNRTLDRAEQIEPNILEDFDLIEVTEQVLQTAYSSYEFKRIADQVDEHKGSSKHESSESSEGSRPMMLLRNIEVVIDADYRPHGYMVHADKGAYRRILLNLLGNALRYTLNGHIIIQIKLTPSETTGLEQLSVGVIDSGIGISKRFLDDLFKPFSQEDEFSTGTGLGLSIVKELVTKLHGTITVKSKKNEGSTFIASYPIICKEPAKKLFPGDGIARELRGVKFHYRPLSNEDDATRTLRRTAISQLVNWFGMQLAECHDADLMIIDERAEDMDDIEQALETFNGPVLSLSSTVVKYERGLRGSSHNLQSFVAKPLGPLKLGDAVSQCLAQAKNLTRLTPGLASLYLDRPSSPTSEGSAAPTVRPTNTNITGGARRSIKDEREERALADVYELQHKEGDIPASPLARQQSNQSSESAHKPHILVVEDNPVNMMLLVRFGKQRGLKVSTAANGALALDLITSKTKQFSAILMDIGMPIMNGHICMSRIRQHEQENGQEPVKIAALTGLSSESDQREALKSGANAFMTKPIRMKELGEILKEWKIIQ